MEFKYEEHILKLKIRGKPTRKQISDFLREISPFQISLGISSCYSIEVDKIELKINKNKPCNEKKNVIK